MAIPINGIYMDGHLGAGKPATTETQTVNSEIAGAAIKYGQAVTLTDDKLQPAAAAPIYGVALSRSYLNADRFTDDDKTNDAWETGEAVGVLREGTIAVPVSADVNKGEGATVDANGLFAPATDATTAVGIFQSDANSGETAFLQTNLAFTSGVGSQSASKGTDGQA